MRRLTPILFLAVGALAVSACDSDDPGGTDGPLAEAEANLGAWTWIDVEGSQCRDGSATGIGVRLQDGADDLVIYLEGGGACFNGATCATNPSSFGEAEFGAAASTRGNVGLFNTTDASNPVADWNMVYVPYCTGDVHAGSFPNNNLLDATQGTSIGVQQFVGHQNVERALALLNAGLDTPGNVLLAGSSAGGLGTLVNFDAVAQTFTSSDLSLVDDSGPLFFADNVLSPPLMDQVIALYSVALAIPDAPQLFAPDALPGIYDYYATTYPGATFGLLSYLGDDTFQQFYGFGQAPGDEITNEEYAAGLRDVRAQLADAWGTYFAEGDDHTFLLIPDRYSGTVGGVSVAEWIGGIVGGSPTDVDEGGAAAL